MKNHSKKSILIAAAIAVGVLFSVSKAEAQKFPYAQQALQLDNYADMMVWAYSDEVRYYGGCPHSSALLRAMRDHAVKTERLKRAYYGNCPTTFSKAACDVRSSLTRVENCRRKARVSPNVCLMVERSCTWATTVHRHRNQFRPVVHHAPVHQHRGHSHGYGLQHGGRVPTISAPPAFGYGSNHNVSGRDVLANFLLQTLSSNLR